MADLSEQLKVMEQRACICHLCHHRVCPDEQSVIQKLKQMQTALQLVKNYLDEPATHLQFAKMTTGCYEAIHNALAPLPEQP